MKILWKTGVAFSKVFVKPPWSCSSLMGKLIGYQDATRRRACWKNASSRRLRSSFNLRFNSSLMLSMCEKVIYLISHQKYNLTSPYQQWLEYEHYWRSLLFVWNWADQSEFPYPTVVKIPLQKLSHTKWQSRVKYANQNFKKLYSFLHLWCSSHKTE